MLGTERLQERGWGGGGERGNMPGLVQVLYIRGVVSSVCSEPFVLRSGRCSSPGVPMAEDPNPSGSARVLPR